MSLLEDLKALIDKYKEPTIYEQFINLCCKVHEKHFDAKPGIVMFLPKAWERDSIFDQMVWQHANKTIPYRHIGWDVQNPFGIIDCIIFTNTDKPIIFEKVNYEFNKKA